MVKYMWIYDKREKVENNLKTYIDMKNFPVIEGYNPEKKTKENEFFNKFLNMGFQGSNLGIAMRIFQKMINEKKQIKQDTKKKKDVANLNIFLSFTGNMISSGNRELITFLVKNKYVDGIVTNAAGIEEDIIKSINTFHLGTFEAKGSHLLDECIGRIGNIFVPADRYLYLERFLNNIFPIILKKAKKGNVMSSHEVTKLLGNEIENNALTKDKKKNSYLYWACRNDIPVFCPAINDGAIGDMAVFFRRNNKSFAIDSTKDNEVLSKLLLNSDKCGSIILGGGVAKHFLLNSAIFRDGFEYSIYITTASEYDGSDSGGNQEEAISWAKIKPDADKVKVFCDATIAFPLLIRSTFNDKI